MIVLASDHRGFPLKEKVKLWLTEAGQEFEDVGCFSTESADYPDFAIVAAEKVASGEAERGIVICGSGIGVSIAANKVAGVRCSLAHNTFLARTTRQHNDSNMLALGADITGEMHARDIVETWLKTPFEGGRHQRRIDKISDYENKR